LLRPPHPPLSPEYGGEDKGEGVCGIPIFVPLFVQKSINKIDKVLFVDRIDFRGDVYK
jgi:hypothetical protein